ncbi:MAG: hypothetical protein SFW66_07145 [Gammaproteobacteria bacterium]|nr:hypothetical protein [Gammaproteobacteria bacterium]
MKSIAQTLYIPELIEGYGKLSSVKKTAFPGALAELLIEGRARDLTRDNDDNTLYALRVCRAYFEHTTSVQRRMFDCLAVFAATRQQSWLNLSYPFAALKLLHQVNVLSNENILPIFKWVVSQSYQFTNYNPTFLIKILKDFRLLTAENALINLNAIIANRYPSTLYETLDMLKKQNLWERADAQANFARIVSHEGPGYYHALMSNIWQDKIPDENKKEWLRSFLYPYATALFEGGIHRLWTSRSPHRSYDGFPDYMPNDSIYSFRDLQEIKLLCDANRDDTNLLKAKVAYYLLAKPEIFAFIAEDWRHRSADSELIDILLTDFKSLAAEQRFELNDFQLRLGNLITTTLIEKNNSHATECLNLLHAFPSFTAAIDAARAEAEAIRAEAEAQEAVTQYLDAYARNNSFVINEDPYRLAMFSPLPGRRRLFDVDNPELTLTDIASNRESAMLALSKEERLIFNRVVEQYKQKVKDLGGVNNVTVMLKNALRTRYENNPASIVNEGKEQIPLPYSYDDFQNMSLSESEREAAYKAYYQHDIHTASRYFLKPNPWISPDALYVNHDPYDCRVMWADFENFLPEVVSLWLAAKDKSFEPLDGFTLETREIEFFKDVALIERAHNWDSKPIDPSSQEECDDLQPDKPSCYGGMKRRLFHSLKGHALVADVAKVSLVEKSLKTMIYRYYHAKLSACGIEERNKVKTALDNVFALEASQEELDHLKTFNIPDSIHAEWLAKFKKDDQAEIDAIFDLGVFNSHLEKFYDSSSVDHIFKILERDEERKEECKEEIEEIVATDAQEIQSQVLPQSFFMSNQENAVDIEELRQHLQFIKTAFKTHFTDKFSDLPAEAKIIHSFLDVSGESLMNPRCSNNQKRYVSGLLAQIENMAVREEKCDDDDEHLLAFYNTIQSNYSLRNSMASDQGRH